MGVYVLYLSTPRAWEDVLDKGETTACLATRILISLYLFLPCLGSSPSSLFYTWLSQL